MSENSFPILSNCTVIVDQITCEFLRDDNPIGEPPDSHQIRPYLWFFAYKIDGSGTKIQMWNDCPDVNFKGIIMAKDGVGRPIYLTPQAVIKEKFNQDNVGQSMVNGDTIDLSTRVSQGSRIFHRHFSNDLVPIPATKKFTDCVDANFPVEETEIDTPSYIGYLLFCFERRNSSEGQVLQAAAEVIDKVDEELRSSLGQMTPSSDHFDFPRLRGPFSAGSGISTVFADILRTRLFVPGDPDQVLGDWSVLWSTEQLDTWTKTESQRKITYSKTSNADFFGSFRPDWSGKYKITATVRVSMEQIKCTIATATYGDPLHSKIYLLRRFRDQKMMTNPAGKILCDLYYRMSPPIALYLRRSPRMRRIFRFFLDILIKIISTHYRNLNQNDQT